MKTKVIVLLTVLSLLMCACATPGGNSETTQDPTESTWVPATEPEPTEPDYSAYNEFAPDRDGIYWIYSTKGLEGIAEHPDGKFRLLCDIDYAGATWTPVAQFSGTLLGDGYTVKNVVIGTADGNTAFIGHLTGKLDRITVDVDLTASSGYAGGLVAVNEGTIENCGVTGTMKLSGNVVAGGLIGSAKGGSAVKCVAGASMEATASATVGLLAGEALETSFASCDGGGAMNTVDGTQLTALSGTDGGNFTDCLYRDNTNSSLFLPEKIQQVRSNIVADMYANGDVAWQTDKMLMWLHPDGQTSTNQVYIPGIIYHGLPYGGHSSHISRFRYCFNEDGSLKDFVNVNPGWDNYDVYFGTDCSSSVYWTWVAYSPSTQWRWTQDTLPGAKQGGIAVGVYEGSDTETDTMVIHKKNDDQTMAEAYACLHYGDAITTYYSNPDDANDHFNHTRMIAEDPVILRDENGLINLDRSYIITHEQGHSTPERNSTWTLYGRYTLRTLRKTCYIPLTCEELITGNIPECEVSVDNSGTGKAYLTTGTVQSNYRIVSTTIKITDEKGAPVWEKTLFTGVNLRKNTGFDYAARTTVREMNIAAFAAYIGEAELKDGKTYQYELSAVPANGETYVLKTFSFVN